MTLRSVALATFAIAVSAPAVQALPDELDVGERPESITKGFDGKFFVTVMNGKEDGDGVVKVIDGDKVAVFAEGLSEPKGICFTGDYLVTTDVTKVWKIDRNGEKSILAEADDFPVEIRYLNDAAAARNGKEVYVTDMGRNDKMRGPDGLWPLDSDEAKQLPAVGRVFRISMKGKVKVAVDASPEMPCPNGVGLGKEGQLLVGAFFTGNFIEAHRGHIHVLRSGFRGADAVEQDSQGRYYVSSWTQGKVWRFGEGVSDPEVLKEGLQSAADFYLDEEAGYLLVPDMLAGKVYKVEL